MKEVLLLTIVLLMIIYRAFNYRKTMKCIRLLNKFSKQIIVIALIFVIVFRPHLLNHLIDLLNRLNLTLDTKLYSRIHRKVNRTMNRTMNRTKNKTMNKTMNRKVSESTKKYVASTQLWKCNKCNNILSATYEVDHIVPLYKNGTNDINNLQALCRNCHGNKTLSDRMFS